MTKTHNQEDNIVLGLIKRIRRRKFLYLAKALLLLIITYPYVQGDMGGQIILSLLATFVMIMSVIAVGERATQ